MKSIRKRHKELAHATPHKLRHTGATAGTSIEAISEALTHSETGTTQIYVNTSNVVPMAVGEFALKSLKQWGENKVNFSKKHEKSTHKVNFWVLWNVDIIVLINVLRIVMLYELS